MVKSNKEKAGGRLKIELQNISSQLLQQHQSFKYHNGCRHCHNGIKKDTVKWDIPNSLLRKYSEIVLQLLWTTVLIKTLILNILIAV